jgi:dipeptidyl aminopeptidase/acylaminoacyl peptidase
MSRTPAPADVRAYLEIRSAGPTGWSPDGRHLLISSDLSGTSQVHRLDLGDHELPVRVEELVPLTRFTEPTGAGYLPTDPTGADRDVLLLASDEGGNERHQLYTADAHPAAPYTEPADLEPLVVDPAYIHRPGGVTRAGDRLAYATNRGDGVAFDTWVRDLTTGEERCVLATGGWTGPGGFSPDGRFLAVSEVTTRPGDNRTYLVDLEAVPVEAPVDRDHPAVVELLPHDDLEPSAVGTPSWSPDSDAFVLSADVGRDHAALWRGRPAVDGEGLTTFELEPVIETGWSTGGVIDWSGSHLLVTWNEGGISRAELRDPHTLEVRGAVPMPGDGVVGGYRFTRDGRYLAFSFSSPLIPGDGWVLDTRTDELTRLTVSPCDVDAATFVDAELVRFASFDGLEVPAFVLRPAPAPDGAPAPVVVVIHGGPESQHRPSFSPLTQYLVASGFAVVAPNVRGSTGYGKRYQHLDDVEKRLDSVADLAGLHDWLAEQPDLDHTRAALYGGSYGGYMVLAGLAFQPERWAAGVDIVGMSDLVTFLQNTSEWRRAYREREYGSLEHDREVLEAASPINRVEAITAPLLIIHGRNDPRVPVSEAEQIHEVLTERGVRCDLLIYEDEGHGLAKLDNRIDAYPKVAAFLHDVLDRD